MTCKTHLFLLSLSITTVLAGCSGTSPRTDVTQYFGKTEQEIKAMLGEPGGPGIGSGGQERMVGQRYAMDTRLVYRRKTTPSLPRPLLVLDLVISKEGAVKQVMGQTTGFDTPEELVDAIGLGHLEKKGSSKDELGVSWKIPPYGLVQVHRPSSMDSFYKDFNITGPH